MTRKPFTPKPFGPGSVVEFTELGLSGVVWSDGPEANSVWLAVDGDTARMVAVKKATAKRPARTLIEGDLGSVIRAAERVREGCYVTKRQARSPYGPPFTLVDLHADLTCPKAAGAEVEILPARKREAAARALVYRGPASLRELGFGNACECLWHDAA